MFGKKIATDKKNKIKKLYPTNTPK
jgi:hypothetical protein